MNYGIARLLALDAVEMCSAKDYIDWAIQELEASAKEPSIAILAGLNSMVTYFEAKEYFVQVLYELEIKEYSDEEKLNQYIEFACKEILADRIPYKEFLDFCREAQFDRKIGNLKYSISNFYLLSWAIQELRAEDPSWSYYYEGLNTTFPEKSVKLECEILLGISKPETSPRFQQTQRINERSQTKQKEIGHIGLFSNLKKWIWK